MFIFQQQEEEFVEEIGNLFEEYSTDRMK